MGYDASNALVWAMSAQERKARKKEDVMRLVEAQIAGCMDLSPDEMIDAAFVMSDKIDERIYGRKKE